jgi:hypothetical protein
MRWLANERYKRLPRKYRFPEGCTGVSDWKFIAWAILGILVWGFTLWYVHWL